MWVGVAFFQDSYRQRGIGEGTGGEKSDKNMSLSVLMWSFFVWCVCVCVWGGKTSKEALSGKATHFFFSLLGSNETPKHTQRAKALIRGCLIRLGDIRRAHSFLYSDVIL
jgi:hypothetical protein